MDTVPSSKSSKSDHKTNLKIQMVIALLCNIINKNSLLLQSMIGLTMYAGGLKGKIIQLLSLFGVTCGDEHIRRQANAWSSKRNVTDELSKEKFWRVTFDNLNFLRRFAKTFTYGSQVAGRMLNLLTGQVTHRVKETTETLENVTSSSQIKSITEELFFPQKGTKEYMELEKFWDSLSNIFIERIKTEPISLEESFIEQLQKHMPSFTPSEADQVVCQS